MIDDIIAMILFEKPNRALGTRSFCEITCSRTFESVFILNVSSYFEWDERDKHDAKCISHDAILDSRVRDSKRTRLVTFLYHVSVGWAKIRNDASASTL